MEKRLLAVAVVIVCFVSAATALADPAPATGVRSKQADYNEGQAALDAQDWDKAIADFTEVLSGSQTAGRSDAVIRVRLADALTSNGRFDEAQAEARKAVAVLQPLASGPDADLADAYLILANALLLISTMTRPSANSSECWPRQPDRMSPTRSPRPRSALSRRAW